MTNARATISTSVGLREVNMRLFLDGLMGDAAIDHFIQALTDRCKAARITCSGILPHRLGGGTKARTLSFETNNVFGERDLAAIDYRSREHHMPDRQVLHCAVGMAVRAAKVRDEPRFS